MWLNDKKKFLMFFLFILTFEINAQVFAFMGATGDVSKMTIVDSSNIRIWYAFNATDINNQETFEDWHRLEIGSRFSKYYSDYLFLSDSLVTEWYKIEKNRRAQSGPVRMYEGFGGKQSNFYYSEYYHTDFFKDFFNSTLTAYAFTPRFIPNYKYIEDIPVQFWELHNDTTTVAGYLCQKATCSFRGRDFVAWFTPDIPVSNGPWKFGGLPGLILKVYDTQELYVFECTNIKFYRQTYHIKKHDIGVFSKTSRENFQKLVKSVYDGKQPATVGRYAKYNPLELE